MAYVPLSKVFVLNTKTPSLSPTEERKQAWGWASMIFFMLLFPALFFLCVYFPMWVGWIIRFP